jgi:hypothetical protein
MKVLCLIVAACFVAYCATPAKRDWQTGTLAETATRESSGGPTAIALNNASPVAAIMAAAAANSRMIWQGFRIQDKGYSFMVMCPVRPKHTPNVTVNGPVKYAMEKGKFYLLDEDGKEWEMTVLEKALVPAPPAPAKKEPQ